MDENNSYDKWKSHLRGYFCNPSSCRYAAIRGRKLSLSNMPQEHTKKFPRMEIDGEESHQVHTTKGSNFGYALFPKLNNTKQESRHTPQYISKWA